MAIEVGQAAPDFELNDPEGSSVKLSDLRGQKVIVVFFPFAFSGLCDNELAAYGEKANVLREKGARLLGISIDSRFTAGVFAETLDLPAEMTLLSDFPDAAAGKAYGAFNADANANERLTVVVDEEGTIIYRVHHAIPDVRDEEEALAVL
ncbi:MAG: redoxin domain-containing protein [Chloroflexota bacterium]|jgi:peroxiredoxin|nr:redoxin domain-containing protein [Chloroflexota bacterium]MDP6508895.1 redoxin domain-containing protein [Chloroflexota bacterium]MDP6757704.1 redoxin domain-containing protein [Chloroflexota bacterium]